jgi:hypothetical protein
VSTGQAEKFLMASVRLLPTTTRTYSFIWLHGFDDILISLSVCTSLFREMMAIVQIAPKTPTRPVENIQTKDLTPYQTDTQDRYVAAYFKADVLPLTFIIGDGKEYNSEDGNYTNQPLKPNTNYIVFLRFFESQVNSLFDFTFFSRYELMFKSMQSF